MARELRAKSATGFYHIRDIGCNHQIIFLEKRDYKKFKCILRDEKEKTGVLVIAYCLMSNHIHLLAGGEPVQIAVFERGVKGRFAQWYNDKYQRSGPLFDGRYKAKGVKDMQQFYALLRYIHINPLAAGMVKSVDEYEFSSYNCYMGQRDDLVDPAFVLEEMDLSTFISLHQKVADDRVFDVPHRKPHLVDEQALEIIFEVTGVTHPSQIQQLSPEFRDLVLSELRRRGLAIRQICRLTGLSKYQVENAGQGSGPLP